MLRHHAGPQSAASVHLNRASLHELACPGCGDCETGWQAVAMCSEPRIHGQGASMLCHVHDASEGVFQLWGWRRRNCTLVLALQVRNFAASVGCLKIRCDCVELVSAAGYRWTLLLLYTKSIKNADYCIGICSLDCFAYFSVSFFFPLPSTTRVI